MTLGLIVWSGNTISGANPGATFALQPAANFAPQGKLLRVWMKGNSTAGSLYFFESGTDAKLATLVAGSNAINIAYPRTTVEDNVNVAAAAGDNLWGEFYVTNPLYLTGSGFTSGTDNKLGTITAEYKTI